MRTILLAAGVVLVVVVVSAVLILRRDRPGKDLLSTQMRALGHPVPPAHPSAPGPATLGLDEVVPGPDGRTPGFGAAVGRGVPAGLGGVAGGLDAATWGVIGEHVAAGRRVAAIELIRKATGVSMGEAKALVDRLSAARDRGARG